MKKETIKSYGMPVDYLRWVSLPPLKFSNRMQIITDRIKRLRGIQRFRINEYTLHEIVERYDYLGDESNILDDYIQDNLFNDLPLKCICKRQESIRKSSQYWEE